MEKEMNFKELSKKVKFLDNIQNNESDLIYAKGVAEKSYTEKETMNLETLGRTVSVDIANVMLECGYAGWIFFRHDNFNDYKEEAKNVLKNDIDIDEVAKLNNTTYEKLIDRIENATQNKKIIDMFKVRDFYCEFSNENPNRDVLNIFINKDNELIKVNYFYFNRDTEVSRMKEFIESTMCNVIGKILEDGTIEKEYYRQGYIYKNYENFYKREGICYVSEYDSTNINDGGISFEGICEEVVDYLKDCDVDLNKITDNQIANMAEDLFEELDWQYVGSLIMDSWLEEYIENLPNDSFINKKNLFKEENNVESIE